MFRFVLFILLFIIFYYILSSLIKAIFFLKRGMDKGSEPEELVQDPYCQTYIPKRSAIKKRVAGRNYYFCNRSCLKSFLNKQELMSGSHNIEKRL